MTTDQKIDEALFWLEHIRFYYPDISILRYYFGAYLSAITSIQDYILAEASEVYNLELPLEETWHSWHFKKKAKEKAEAGENNALNFYNWWDAWISTNNRSLVGKVFTKLRNMDMHKKKQKPMLNILVLPVDEKSYEKPSKISVEITGDGVISSIEELNISIDSYKPKFLERINKVRKERGDPLATEIKVAEYLQVEGLPNFGSLLDACEIELQYWVDFVKHARGIFAGGKTGLEGMLKRRD